MITTNDEAIFKKLRTLTWLGVEKSTYDRVGKLVILGTTTSPAEGTNLHE